MTLGTTTKKLKIHQERMSVGWSKVFQSSNNNTGQWYCSQTRFQFPKIRMTLLELLQLWKKKQENKPILYAHGTYGESYSKGDNLNTISKIFIPYSAHPTFSAVKVRDGTIAEPLQVTVRSGDSPFEFKGGTKL